MAVRSGRVGSALAVTHDVEVVWLDLEPSRDELAALEGLLRGDERARVERRATPVLRRRATVSLARRRQVAAGLLGVQPDDVDLVARDDGTRAAVAPDGHVVALSVSTCGDVGLVAAARDRAVGVDVEDFDELPSTPAFAARVTTDDELSTLSAMGDADRQRALLRLWTRKEAYLKATGEGIGSALRRVTVPLDPGLEGERFWPTGDGAAWHLYELACTRESLAAALVVSVDSAERAPALHVTAL